MFTLFKNNLLNDIFDMPYYRFDNKELPTTNSYFGNFMKTDIVDKDNAYELAIDLPGFGKEDIKLSFDNGYLVVAAEKNAEADKDEANYIRKERCHSSVKRSYYLGKNFNINDIKASHKDGILNITITKPDLAKLEESKLIQIEG